MIPVLWAGLRYRLSLTTIAVCGLEELFSTVLGPSTSAPQKIDEDQTSNIARSKLARSHLSLLFFLLPFQVIPAQKKQS
jgi:hypothetical protein